MGVAALAFMGGCSFKSKSERAEEAAAAFFNTERFQQYEEMRAEEHVAVTQALSQMAQRNEEVNQALVAKIDDIEDANQQQEEEIEDLSNELSKQVAERSASLEILKNPLQISVAEESSSGDERNLSVQVNDQPPIDVIVEFVPIEEDEEDEEKRRISTNRGSQNPADRFRARNFR